MAKIFPYQRYANQDWAGLTTENNLGALYAEQPLQVSNIIEQIYKVNLGDDLITYVNKFPTLEIEDDREFQWDLMGADEKSIQLIDATDAAGNQLHTLVGAKAGQNGAKFFMTFPEKYFFATHVIVGEKPDLYALRITRDAEQIGSSFRYEVELVTGDRNLFVPVEEIQPGTKWSIDYSLSPQTLSDKGSDFHFTSPFKMANRMSMIRKEHTVPANMINKGNKPNIFFIPDGKGKAEMTWLNYLDWNMWRQFRREKARLLMFGKSNRREDGTYSIIDANGYEVKAGSGLREQIAPSNRHYFNSFNLKTLVDFIYDQLSLAKLPEDQRKFVIGTGEYGFRMVSEAIEGAVGAAALDFNRISQLSGNTGGLTGGMGYRRPQFTKYYDYNGIQFELMHIPEYDDEVRNKIKHPDGGVAESRRLTIMDFGTSSGEPNIQMVRQKGQDEVFKFIPGLRDPWSPNAKGKNPQATSSKTDGYELMLADWCGIKVHNPRRLGEFIPAILR